MDTTTNIHYQTSVAARIAGEDLRKGDFVTVLNETVELPSFLWNCSEVSFPADEPVCIRYMAHDAGQPYRVIDVCLPFVYAKRARGGMKVIDTRRQQLVRLDPERGLSVWKALRKQRKKKVK